jgi:carbon monoxide dehydrogenase subunit G
LKVAGSYTLPVARERAYELLQDPEILAKCMPGTERLDRTGPDEYEMKMKMVISAVQGLFAGKIRIADQKPPEQFRLIVEGSGKVGFMKGEGMLTLVPANSGTDVHYEGEVHVGGVIAGVGQRLLDTTAKIVIRKFFEKLVENSGQVQQAVAAPSPPPPSTITS